MNIRSKWIKNEEEGEKEAEREAIALKMTNHVVILSRETSLLLSKNISMRLCICRVRSNGIVTKKCIGTHHKQIVMC